VVFLLDTCAGLDIEASDGTGRGVVHRVDLNRILKSKWIFINYIFRCWLTTIDYLLIEQIIIVIL